MKTPFDYLDYLLQEMVLSDDPDHAHRRAIHSLFASRIAEAKAETRAEVLATAYVEAKAEAKREVAAELRALISAATSPAMPRASRPTVISFRRGRR